MSSNLFEMRKYLTINTGATANSKDQIFLVTSSQRVSERGEQLFSEVSEQKQMALVFYDHPSHTSLLSRYEEVQT